MESAHSTAPGAIFSRIWDAFETGEILSACAWCGRVRIDDTWLRPSLAALVAIDQRLTFSHSICEWCIASIGTPDRAGGASGDAAPGGPRE